jgi:nucleotide-binding universal stress UspA family protein
VKLAQRFEADLRLVRIDSTPQLMEQTPPAPLLAITQQSLRDERLARVRKLEALGVHCRALGEIRVMTALQEGPVGPTLREYAKKFHADLIVMSSNARGGLKRLALGSITDYLIRHTNVPVLVVKPPVLFMPTLTETFSRILVPLDGSPLAEQILPEVTALAKELKASVSLLRVLTPDTYSQKQIMQPGLPWWDAAIDAANAYLTRTANYLAHFGVPATMDVVLSDDVTSAILDYGKRTGANLIALATSGAGGMERFVFGTVADELTRQSETSLLVFHPKRARISDMIQADADALAVAEV